MKNPVFRKLQDFVLTNLDLRTIKGGYICGCKAAAPYSCSAAGYNTNGDYNTSQFNKCLNDTYAGCCQLDPSCAGSCS